MILARKLVTRMKKIEDMVDSSGMLLTKNTLEQGFSKFQIYSFTIKNKFECVAQGVYASPNAWEDENYILSLRCPQGVFFHDEALYHYRFSKLEPRGNDMDLLIRQLRGTCQNGRWMFIFHLRVIAGSVLRLVV